MAKDNEKAKSTKDNNKGQKPDPKKSGSACVNGGLCADCELRKKGFC